MGLTLLAAGAIEKVFASNLPRVSPHHPHFGGGCDLGLSRGFVLVLHKAGATGREQEIESDKFDVGVCAHRQCVKVQTERRSLSLAVPGRQRVSCCKCWWQRSAGLDSLSTWMGCL